MLETWIGWGGCTFPVTVCPMLTVVPGEGSGEEGGKDGSSSLIDEIVREGARRSDRHLR